MTDHQFTIRNVKEFDGNEVTLKGWVFNKRSSGSIAFLQLRDGTGFIQGVVVKDEVDAQTFKNAQDVAQESSVIIKGKVKAEPRAPSGFELSVVSVEIIQRSLEYPIAKKDHGPDFLLSHRHLWLRSKRQWAIQRVRNQIIYAIYQHFEKEGFIKIDSPIFTPNACEGTTTLFPVPYLPGWSGDVKETPIDVILSSHAKEIPYVYLSQSGQLYLEAAIMAHGKVFDFGPTFRAEKSKTRRHLTEFWMMDAEMAFVEHKENMKSQERLLVAIVKRVLTNSKEELKILGRNTILLEKIIEGNFPIITHTEAVERLTKAGSSLGDRDDFGADAETILSKQFEKPVFIEKYPKELKAFYMKETGEDNRVWNNDLLAPEGYGEIIGGSQREDNFEELQKKMKEHNLSEEDYSWYLDLRKYGSVPHSGYGMGLERVVAWICGLEHVRETIPFPRMMDRVKP